MGLFFFAIFTFSFMKGGIHTIKDLQNADEKDIASIRNVGNGKRFGLIMAIKLSLE